MCSLLWQVGQMNIFVMFKAFDVEVTVGLEMNITHYLSNILSLRSDMFL